jgi:carboxypeptidase Q
LASCLRSGGTGAEQLVMVRISRIAILSIAFSASAGAIAAYAAPLPETLAVTASNLGQKALDDPAAYDFVASLTTEIGQRLAGTEAHKRAVAWAETRLKAAGFDNVHSEPFTLSAWIRGAESAEIVGPVPQHLAITALGGSVATDAKGI